MWFSRLLFKIFWWISHLGKCIQLTIYSIRQSFGHPKNIFIILEKCHDFNIFSLLHDHLSALYQNLFINPYVIFVLWSSYKNNEINSAKNETYMWFSVVVGGNTYYYWRPFYPLLSCWLYLIPVLQYLWMFSSLFKLRIPRIQKRTSTN